MTRAAVLFGASLCVVAPVSAELVATRGDARAVEGDAIVYTEHHLLRREDGVSRERLVLYRCPDGGAFARKTLDYGDTPSQPAFRMHDANVSYVEGARRDDDGALVVFSGLLDGSVLQEWTAPSGPVLVVDAGFDEFIRSHWAQLRGGTPLTIAFVVPNRGKAYDFRLAKVREDSIGGEAVTVLRLRLGGLFGLFAPDIDLTYRNSDARLMRFEGLTSVRRNREDNLSARIDFPLDADHVAADDAWQSALATPLEACSTNN